MSRELLPVHPRRFWVSSTLCTMRIEGLARLSREEQLTLEPYCRIQQNRSCECFVKFPTLNSLNNSRVLYTASNLGLGYFKKENKDRSVNV